MSDEPEVCGNCRWGAPHDLLPGAAGPSGTPYAAEDVRVIRVANGGRPDLECRRFPPTQHDSGAYIFTQWPYVDGRHWCGEWEPAE